MRCRHIQVLRRKYFEPKRPVSTGGVIAAILIYVFLLILLAIVLTSCSQTVCPAYHQDHKQRGKVIFELPHKQVKLPQPTKR